MPRSVCRCARRRLRRRCCLRGCSAWSFQFCDGRAVNPNALPHRLRCETMAQIVESHIGHIEFSAEYDPEFKKQQIPALCRLASRMGEYVKAVTGSAFAQAFQKFNGVFAEPDRPCPGLAVLKVELIRANLTPAQAHNFTRTASREQKQFYGIGIIPPFFRRIPPVFLQNTTCYLQYATCFLHNIVCFLQ